MISDDERREVAERLRWYRGGFSPSSVRNVLAIIVGLDDGPFAGKRLFDRLADLIEPQPITGDTSDGYHTFNELYDHRAKLFSVIVRCFKDRSWKSKLHHDGTMYEGMFIVGIETSQGQATYHYDIDPYWNVFDCKELARAPEWDGHTPEQAISRIASLRPSCDREALLALAEELSGNILVVPAVYGTYQSGYVAACQDIARRIREACGEEGA